MTPGSVLPVAFSRAEELGCVLVRPVKPRETHPEKVKKRQAWDDSIFSDPDGERS